MSWEFLHIQRTQFRGTDNWGYMCVRTEANDWEKLCYTYELPWKVYQRGAREGKTITSQSRIIIGNYEMKPRSDKPKGWRLELQGTGHRRNIQIHRAHKTMYIEGCILPVHIMGFPGTGIEKGDYVVQKQSEILMVKIKERYELLSKSHEGNPIVVITALLPAMIKTDTRFV